MPANPSGVPLHPPMAADAKMAAAAAWTPYGADPAEDQYSPAPAGSAEQAHELPSLLGRPVSRYSVQHLDQLRHMSAEVDGIAERVKGDLALEQEKLRLEEQVTRLQRTLQHVNRALEEEEEGRRRDAHQTQELRAMLDDAAAAAEQHKAARDEALAELREYERALQKQRAEFDEEKAMMNSHFARTGGELRDAQQKCDRLAKEGEVLRSWLDRGAETAAESEELRRRCEQLQTQQDQQHGTIRAELERERRAVEEGKDAASSHLSAGLLAAVPALFDAARRANAAATALRSGSNHPLNAVGPQQLPLLSAGRGHPIAAADAERAGRQAQELAASTLAALATLDLAVADTLHVQQRWQEGAREQQSHTMELRRMAEKAQEELSRHLHREAEVSGQRQTDQQRYEELQYRYEKYVAQQNSQMAQQQAEHQQQIAQQQAQMAQLQSALEQWKERALMESNVDVPELQRQMHELVEERDALRGVLQTYSHEAANTSCPPTPSTPAGPRIAPAESRSAVSPAGRRQGSAAGSGRGAEAELWQAQAVAATLYREKAALQRLYDAQQRELAGLRRMQQQDRTEMQRLRRAVPPSALAL